MKPRPKIGEVGAHHVSRVLGPTEARFHQREPSLHEDHEDRADDHPQQVQLPAERDHGIGLHRRETDRKKLHPLPPIRFGQKGGGTGR